MRNLLFAFLTISLMSTAAINSPASETDDLERIGADLKSVKGEIAAAEADYALYSGGLIKSLIAIRLEVLRTTASLLEQRVYALQTGSSFSFVVPAKETDPERARALKSDIELQEQKLQETEAEAAKYSGGLIKAMALSAAATQRNTIAMLEQAYLIEKFGLVIPALSISDTGKAAEPPVPGGTSRKVDDPAPTAKDCLEIVELDSSVLSTNDLFVELAWKVDVENRCNRAFGVEVTFTLFDADDFMLDDDDEQITIPANGIGKARGKMLVSPIEKANRMNSRSASISLVR